MRYQIRLYSISVKKIRDNVEQIIKEYSLLASHSSLRFAFNNWKIQKAFYERQDEHTILVFDTKMNKYVRFWSDGNILDYHIFPAPVHFIDIAEYERKYT